MSKTDLGKPPATPPAPSHAIMIGLKLLKVAFVYLAVQLVLILIGRYYFLSNPRAGRAIYHFFAKAEDLTLALQRLRAFYLRPIDGVEFSQVFAVYLLILAFLLFYFIALCAGMFSGLFKNLRWREWMWRDYALFTVMLGLGLWTFLFFLLGPTSMSYRSLLNFDFVTSVCLFVPMGQFIILVDLVLYFTMGASSRKKA